MWVLRILSGGVSKTVPSLAARTWSSSAGTDADVLAAPGHKMNIMVPRLGANIAFLETSCSDYYVSSTT